MILNITTRQKVSLRNVLNIMSIHPEILSMEEILHNLRCKTPWHLVNNGINYQPQLLQDFFHQQYPEHWPYWMRNFKKTFTFGPWTLQLKKTHWCQWKTHPPDGVPWFQRTIFRRCWGRHLQTLEELLWHKKNLSAHRVFSEVIT